jgi:hypothetical protein
MMRSTARHITCSEPTGMSTAVTFQLYLYAQDFDKPKQKRQHHKEVLTWERSSLSFSYSGLPRSSPAAQHAQHCKLL